MPAEKIYIKPGEFDSSIGEMDKKRVAFEDASEKIIKRLGFSVQTDWWKGMYVDAFEEGATTMKRISDQHVRNLYFLYNVLGQVKLDFENADQT